MSAIYYPALHRYIGTSEDVKPTVNVADGTGFEETDTSASPSAPGLAAKATLEARGNTVTVN